jgi:hypothetical protein
MAAATFQSTININQGFGVVGELILDGPLRADVLNLDVNGGSVGLAFTKSNTTGVATQGGTIAAGVVFAGILVNPKSYASYGSATGTLDPTLVLPGYARGEFLTMGTIVVALTTSANIGDLVVYTQATGALSAIAPTASPSAGQALVPNAVVWGYPTSAAGLVAIRLTN